MTALLAGVDAEATPIPRPAQSARPALRVVVRPAPHREPPFDDELTPELIAATPSPYDLPLPLEIPPRPRRPVPLPRLSTAPDPVPWATRLLIGLAETAAGRRPLAQLAPLLGLGVARGVGNDFDRGTAERRPHWLSRATVRSVRASEPTEGVAEVCATVEVGPRVRAVAMRLDLQHGRWRCTRLQLG